jgi:hypothetical protein
MTNGQCVSYENAQSLFRKRIEGAIMEKEISNVSSNTYIAYAGTTTQ